MESEKIRPGISTFAEDVAAVGPDHLKTLIDVAMDRIPSSKIPQTPIFLMATAGVRLLSDLKQQALLQGVCTYLQANTQFDLPDCGTHIQVIPGETEGLYGWIATNYLLGGFDNPDQHDHGKGHHTYGFLDMGGASAQIAFAPNTTIAEQHANDLKVVRMRHLDGTPSEYRVFTTTWLGFGANQARDRYIKDLQKEYGEADVELPDPCLPRGLRTNLEGDLVNGNPVNVGSDQVLVGTGLFKECLRRTYPLLEKEAPCDDQPCLVNGQHVPAIDFNINHFVGVSEYWHTTHGVFGDKHKAYDLATYQTNVLAFCSQDWSDIEHGLDRRKKSSERKAADTRQACFKASWVINMLYDGIGIPRVGLESPPVSGNSTKEDGDKDKAVSDPFKPIDTIDGVELSWTLGKMVLYAAGQVQGQESALPVGFGSNVKSGVANDFEHAGSSPIAADVNIGEDYLDDLDRLAEKTPKLGGGLFLCVLVAIILAYLFRKSDRRRKIWRCLRGGRKHTGRRPNRGFILANRIFGGTAAAYERIMEEGDASQYELGGFESEENDSSDSLEEQHVAQASGLATPALKAERLDDIRLPSVLGRSGLAVRTGSYERLSPSLQMLNAGRRSRAGSPTRQKSPLALSLPKD